MRHWDQPWSWRPVVTAVSRYMSEGLAHSADLCGLVGGPAILPALESKVVSYAACRWSLVQCSMLAGLCNIPDLPMDPRRPPCCNEQGLLGHSGW